ncbi:hypothetical protein [Weeksella sp. HMSC059D05]|uniref:SGNH/GDSL hydrolase family protein n=2 Tax=Weeksella virosa TaxID=1014 RepID=F0NZM5_WEEVC|nr:hypothetical protein [Weeksella sp. HMSC059D05]ADX67284.1 hypothetical protein Weevi_0565 [Weeksella virosa DSM 16922]OFM81874.1 hypothetical protein HMPREF2660_05850 [Weeksella sp. HMSC059D05]SUP53565.1 Uncharacterised protein [Weeksella virosa]VEH62980.1 Uncharacterised protein [Weeksella virosa]
MKRFLIQSSLFALFAIAFYLIVMPLWSSIFPPFMAKNVRNCMGCYGHTFTRTKNAKTVDSIDVLIVGSSHAYRGIDPRAFEKYGIKAFNLGSSSQTPINTKMLLHQYLDIIEPKLVIYEAYAGTLEIDGVESSLDLLSNNQIDKNSVEMALDVHNLLAYNTLWFSTVRQFLGMNKNLSEPLVQGLDTYISPTGFVQTSYRKNLLLDEKIQQWNLRENQLQALKENIAFIKAHNSKVFLIQTPITNKLYESKTNNSTVDKLLHSYGEYMSYQGLVELNDTLDFYDSNHMNQNAVEKFSDILALEVKNRYF